MSAKKMLPRLEDLDTRLTGLGLPFARLPTAGFLQGARPSFAATCADEIGERYEPEIAERLVKLLRVEALRDPQSPSS